MDLITVIYLADVVNNVVFLLSMLAMFSFIVACTVCLHTLHEGGSLKNAFAIFVFSVTMSLISSIIPSKQAIYMMAGAKVVQDISKDPRTQNTLDKIYKIIDNKLDEQLNKGEKK